jgi:hypothetical protein
MQSNPPPVVWCLNSNKLWKKQENGLYNIYIYKRMKFFETYYCIYNHKKLENFFRSVRFFPLFSLYNYGILI